MASTVLPKSVDATQQFMESLLAARVVDASYATVLEHYLATGGERKPAALADYLVQRGVLTAFQAALALQRGAGELVLSQFVLVDQLGQGAMGPAFKARSTRDDGWYAVKVVPRRNVANLNDVAQKVRTLKDIRHPRVSTLVSLGAVGERVFLAWPYLEGGETLDAFVQRNGRLSPRQAIQIASQVASGLKPYHDAGLFHGLLKPSDVLIGKDRRVRVLDFGVGFLLATERGKALLDTITSNRTLARGLDCASPESLLNPLDRSPAGDRYSLGCILYYLLTGQFPFPMENPLQKMMAHQLEQPRPVRELNPEVSPRLAAVVETLMRKKPGERYADTEEVVQTLLVASGSVSLARPTGPSIINGVHGPTVEKEEPGGGLLDGSDYFSIGPRKPATLAKAREQAGGPGDNRTLEPHPPQEGRPARAAARSPIKPSQHGGEHSLQVSDPSAPPTIAPPRAARLIGTSSTSILVILASLLGVIIGGVLYGFLRRG